MKRKHAVGLLTLTILALLLAGGDAVRVTGASSPVPAPEARSEGMQTYRGDGFSLQYPANAQIKNTVTDPDAASEVHIVGPELCVRPCDADWSYTGPAYELTVQTYPNPGCLDAEAWAREHMLAAWRRAQEKGEPLMGSPVSEDGEIDEQEVGRAEIAGYPAFQAIYFAGDSCRRVFFVAHAGQVIALSFYDYPPGNQPMALFQQDMHLSMMSTVRLQGE